MNRFPDFLKIFLAAACVTWCACSAQHLTGGTSTSENARVKGRIVDQNGAAVGGAQVLLLPVDYDPVKDSGAVAADTTDALGEYVFTKIIAGVYSIQALDMAAKGGAIIRGIQVSDRFDSLTADTVRGLGSVKIAMSASVNLENGYIYIPGTTFFAFLKNNSGFVTLDSVPGAKSLDVYYASTNSPAPTIFRYGVRVTSGDTAVVWNFGWNYSRKITLNTSASGANVAGDVTNFPALVRLTAANFDFTQARNNGEDIRFAKQDNTFLSYEIERWDPIEKRAELWVKVDTVLGNDSTQTITMYWDNIDAPGQSNSASVFDTANGFQGVWHLNEPGNAIAKDATVNHYDGTPSDTAPSGTAGVIGPCRSFNGSSNYFRMNGTANSKLNFQENGIYTISAWAYADTLDYGFHLVVGKGNEQYFLKFKNINPSIPNSTMVWEFVEYHDKAGYSITNSLPSGKVWTHLVGVRNGPVQHFYVNGELVDSTAGISAFNVPRNTGEDVSIGKYLSMPADTTGGKCPFLGMIDEVRISNVACGADWIKLSYMNQKENDALVKW